MPVQLARLAKLLGAPADRATFEQITALTAKKVREDADLDFKQVNSYVAGGDGAEELAKDVTGMNQREAQSATLQSRRQRIPRFQCPSP